MRKNRSPAKYQPKNAMLMASLLANMLLKRRSYSMQLLKQFILFPDESQSSQKTVSKYDSLIFSDEEIHTMFKKLQTKLLQRKIWAFLNLKYHRYRQAVKKMQKPIINLKKRAEHQHKAYSFIQIKTFSEIKTRNTKLRTETNTTIQQQPAIVSTPKKTELYSPKKYQGSSNNIEISIDITHRTTCAHAHVSPSHRYSPRSPTSNIRPPSYIRSESRIESQSQIQSMPSVAYPISQLHPSQPRVEYHDDRQNRFRNENENREGRSRSGSITRYQLDMEGSSKKVINGKEVPVYIKLKRSQRTPEQPQYTVIYQPSRIQETKPSTWSRAELQKRQNLKYEYQNQNVFKQSNIDGRGRVTPSKIYGQVNENGQNCPNRNSARKIIRLRSSSKKDSQNGYMQHLHN